MSPLNRVSRQPAFRPFAEAFVPELCEASPAVWARLEATVDRALADRPERVRRQFLAFLRLLSITAVLRFGRTPRKLAIDRRLRLLRRFERGGVMLLRRGVWGFRTLVMMGFYTQPETMAALGYRASPAGWGARR